MRRLLFVAISIHAVLFSFSTYANSCEMLLAEPRHSERSEGSPTASLITYLSRLLDENLIGDAHLVRFVEGLERGEVVNPILEEEAQTNFSLMVQRGGLEHLIQSDTLDREALSVWAQETLSERGVVRVQRKVVCKDTQMHFQSMEFVLIPDQSYSMSRFLVTQWQWIMVTGMNPSHFSEGPESIGIEINRTKIKIQPNHPVEQVSEEDVHSFLTQLNYLSQTNDPVIYKIISDHALGKVYRLPTDVEWEYATRAGTDTQYSFGDDEAKLKDYAWFKDNANGTTHAVGLKRPNLWGLYDVHGNVWEWTSDPSGSNHVFRGGGWSSDARYLRSANRDRYAPDYRNGTLGFRLVRADE